MAGAWRDRPGQQPIGGGRILVETALPGADTKIMMEIEMRGFLRAGAVAMALYGGVAAAQTETETTTMQSTTVPAVPQPAVPPPLVAPPPGTLATVHTSRTVDAYGNEVDQQKTTYQNSQGVAQDTRTVTRTMPAPPPVSTTTTTKTEETTTPNQ
jgi:hypothetical protein